MISYVNFLYLNNAAITLLLRQHYTESIETFQDAVNIHRIIFHHEEEFVTQTSLSLSNHIENSNNMIEEMLKKASKRLAVSTTTNTNHVVKMSILDPMIVLDMMDDDFTSILLKYEKCIDQIDFMIRMNNNNDNDNNTSISKLSNCCLMQIQYRKILNDAILIFNFGVACKRSSEVNDEYGYSDEYRMYLRDQSIQLFCSANRIITDVMLNHTHSPIISTTMTSSIHNINQDYICNLLYAMAVSIFTTSYINDARCWENDNDSIDSGGNIDYHAYYQKKLHFLKKILTVYMKYSDTANSTTKNAAAA